MATAAASICFSFVCTVRRNHLFSAAAAPAHCCKAKGRPPLACTGNSGNRRCCNECCRDDANGQGCSRGRACGLRRGAVQHRAAGACRDAGPRVIGALLCFKRVAACCCWGLAGFFDEPSPGCRSCNVALPRTAGPVIQHRQDRRSCNETSSGAPLLWCNITGGRRSGNEALPVAVGATMKRRGAVEALPDCNEASSALQWSAAGRHQCCLILRLGASNRTSLGRLKLCLHHPADL